MGTPRGAGGMHPPKHPKVKLKKKTEFCRYYDIRILRDLPFSRNHPMKSADDYYVGILKKELI
jgi:hypothetical protein